MYPIIACPRDGSLLDSHPSIAEDGPYFECRCGFSQDGLD